MDLWKCIEANLTWTDLPSEVRAQLHNEPKKYEEQIMIYSYQNQLRYDQYIRSIMRREKKYYENLIDYGKQHYLLYPYHLQDKIVRGLQITSFVYYRQMLINLILTEKSYDCLPNFTAADCLRLIGIGRNQYIELINTFKSFISSMGQDEKELQGLLNDIVPSEPVETVVFEPWHIVRFGSIMLADIQVSTDAERFLIDQLIDAENFNYASGGKQEMCGIYVKDVDQTVLRSLFRRGLVYMEVPVENNDRICVPTLEGFVMNRISGDTRENLLYKIFVTADENTTIDELAECLQVDINLVRQAASVFCRLGFAYKRISNESLRTPGLKGPLSNMKFSSFPENSMAHPLDNSITDENPNGQHKKKLVVIFDSTITAYLMMGNLSTGLKPHAVTMFEVGKLSDDSLNSFLTELNNLAVVNEGEARMYHEHALNLRETIHFLRDQAALETTDFCGIDLIRGGSLLSLEPETRARILHKNYALIVSLIPSTHEDQQATDIQWPPHLGPPISEANSPWFSFFISCVASNVFSTNKNLPQQNVILPSMLLASGTRISKLPASFHGTSQYSITAWGHDPVIVDGVNFLSTVNDMLLSSPLLVQAINRYDYETEYCQRYIPLPLSKEFIQYIKSISPSPKFFSHLINNFDLTSITGYITVLAPIKKNSNNDNDDLLINFDQECIYQSFESANDYLISLKNENNNNDNVVVDDDEDDEYNYQSENLVLIESELYSLMKHCISILFINLHLGLPIFNSKLNQTVCKRILKSNLLSINRRVEVEKTNNLFVKYLNEFIYDHCSALLPNQNERVCGHLPVTWGLPTKSLICANGLLEKIFISSEDQNLLTDKQEQISKPCTYESNADENVHKNEFYEEVVKITRHRTVSSDREENSEGPSHQCCVCGIRTLEKCLKCNWAAYCSTFCYDLHRPIHQYYCNKIYTATYPRLIGLDIVPITIAATKKYQNQSAQLRENSSPIGIITNNFSHKLLNNDPNRDTIKQSNFIFSQIGKNELNLIQSRSRLIYKHLEKSNGLPVCAICGDTNDQLENVNRNKKFKSQLNLIRSNSNQIKSYVSSGDIRNCITNINEQHIKSNEKHDKPITLVRFAGILLCTTCVQIQTSNL